MKERKRQELTTIDPTMMETKKIIKWVDGSPTAIEQHSMNKHQIGNTLGVVMANEYQPVDEEDRKQNGGKTNAQVLLERLVENALDGDMDSTKEVLDRMVGKPVAHQVQDIRAMNVNMTYEDFLDNIDEEDLELDDFHMVDPEISGQPTPEPSNTPTPINVEIINDEDVNSIQSFESSGCDPTQSFESGYNAKYSDTNTNIDDISDLL